MFIHGWFCIRGSPSSMNMVCPFKIGRDVWVWGGQKSVGWLAPNSPQDLGEEALAEWARLHDGNGVNPG